MRDGKRPLHSARGRRDSRSSIQYFTPSYSLYPVLAAIHGAHGQGIGLASDFGLPNVRQTRGRTTWDSRAALTYVTTPNAPSGRSYRTEELEALACAQRGVVILD